MDNNYNNKFLINDLNGISRTALVIGNINIQDRTYVVYSVYNNEGNYELYFGRLISNEIGYDMEPIIDEKEHEMLMKVLKKPISLV